MKLSPTRGAGAPLEQKKGRSINHNKLMQSDLIGNLGRVQSRSCRAAGWTVWIGFGFGFRALAVISLHIFSLTRQDSIVVVAVGPKTLHRGGISDRNQQVPPPLAWHDSIHGSRIDTNETSIAMTRVLGFADLDTGRTQLIALMLRAFHVTHTAPASVVLL